MMPLQAAQLALFDDTVVDPPAAPAPGPRHTQQPMRRVQVPGAVLSYELRRARRRTIGFVVDDRGLTVSAPRWVAIAEIEQGIVEKSRWIMTKLREWQERKVRMPALEWAGGARIPLLGREVQLHLDPSAELAQLLDDCSSGSRLVLPLPLDADTHQIRDRVQGWMQAEAQSMFAERLAIYCERLGVAVGKWKLSSARTRWGSCTADGTIRLNWRLLHFPLSAIDYVITHEIAHRREMNHGPAFWRTVESAFPEFRAAEDLLKASATILQDH
jgi:predicted metal-dependent hydrolase